jgi:hypothetical protein
VSYEWRDLISPYLLQKEFGKMKKYSEVVEFENKKFRYNYDESLLEYVSNRIEETSRGDIIEFDELEVIDEIGLNEKDWKEEKMIHIENWSYMLDEEVSYLEKEFIEEMKHYANIKEFF